MELVWWVQKGYTNSSSRLLWTGRGAAPYGQEGVTSGRRLAARNTLHQSRWQQRDAVSSHTRAGSPRRFFSVLCFVGLSNCFRSAAVGRFPQQIVSQCSAVKAATFNYEIIRKGEKWCIIEAQILATIRQRQRKLEQRGEGLMNGSFWVGNYEADWEGWN